MDDDWDVPSSGAPQGAGGQGFASEGGLNFSSRGRGFSVKSATVGGSDDWGSSGGDTGGGSGRRGGRGGRQDDGGNSWGNKDDTWGSGGGGEDRPRRGGRGGGRGGGRRDNDDGNDNGNGWGGGGGGGEDRPRRGGRGGGRGGRRDNDEGGDSSWGNSNNDAGGDSWGNSGGDSDRPRRGRGGRGGGGRGRGDSNANGEDSWGGASNNDDSWGGDSSESRPQRGGRRGGRGGGGSRNDNEGGWGDNGDSNERGESGGRGRGGRRGGGQGGGGGGGWGDDENSEGNKDGAEPPKNREIYIPPEPTTDENELFHSGNTSGINFAKYDDIEVEVSGENVPKPITTFESSGLRPLLLENIQKSGYTKPTPIQKHAIPIIVGGRDLMACAQTGSGKTAAYLLPIINSLLGDPVDLVYNGECAEPQAIIVSPTRELAMQIYDECRKFSLHSAIKVVLTYGGTSVGYQRKHVVSGCHILVATPGRMNDFAKRGTISFASTRFVVLDEADRMLDMGFLSSMEEMLSHSTMTATGERRTLMFSATFPEEIQRLAAKFLENYIFVAVGIVGGACTDVEQVFYQVDKFKKRNKLLEIFKEEGTDRTLVFVETKRNADFLATYLSENDFQTTSIHGDRLQREREEALRDFKRGSRNILVATAVAARGLDIKDVKHVINYDLPKEIDEYVHRIGRTGRVGNRGKATSFFDDAHDNPLAPNLSKILKQAGQPVPDWLGRGGGGSYSNQAFGGRDVRGDDFGQPKAVEIDDEEW